MTAALAVQKAIRDRLVATPAVTGLVPEEAILDRNQRPAPSPSIVLGEAQLVDEGDSIARDRTRVVHTAHVWKQEESLAGVNRIAAEIRSAIHAGRLGLDPGFHCIDALVSGIRALRDPDGAHSHAVVTIEVLVQEVA